MTHFVDPVHCIRMDIPPAKTAGVWFWPRKCTSVPPPPCAFVSYGGTTYLYKSLCFSRL